MGYKCCVAGCKSGYLTSNVEVSISFFDFPFDPALRKKWIDQCHRKDFQPTKYSRVCSLHFDPEDLVQTAKLRKLLPSAWPRLHPQLKTRFEKPASKRTTQLASSSVRLRKENEVLKFKNNKLLNDDYVSNYRDFCSMIGGTKLPNGFVTVINDCACSFLLIEEVTKNPCCVASVLVSDESLLTLFINRKTVLLHHVNHLLSAKGKISNMTEIANILAYVKSIATGGAESDSVDVTVDVAANLLQSIVSDSEEHASLISFIVNQLRL